MTHLVSLVISGSHYLLSAELVLLVLRRRHRTPSALLSAAALVTIIRS